MTAGWRQQSPPNHPQLPEDLAQGIVYFSGRDSDLRPALVIRGCRVPSQWYKEMGAGSMTLPLLFLPVPPSLGGLRGVA